MTHQHNVVIKQEPCSPCPPSGEQPRELARASPGVYQNLMFNVSAQEQISNLQQPEYIVATNGDQNRVSWDTPMFLKAGLPSSDQETKNRLKQSLLRKRKDLENIDDLFEDKKPCELTPADLERRERRKMQNRNAAKRCRHKKRKLQEEALQETEKMNQENENLKEQVSILTDEVKNLHNIIEAHVKSGLCQIPEHFQQLSVQQEVPVSAHGSENIPVSTDALRCDLAEPNNSHVSGGLSSCQSTHSSLVSCSTLGSSSSYLASASSLGSQSNFASSSSGQSVILGSVSNSTQGMPVSLSSTSSHSSLPTETVRTNVEESIILDNPVPQVPEVLPSWDLINLVPDYVFCGHLGDRMMGTFQEVTVLCPKREDDTLQDTSVLTEIPEKASYVRNLTAEFNDFESKLNANEKNMTSQSSTIIVSPEPYSIQQQSGLDSPSILHCVAPNLVQQFTPPSRLSVDNNNNNVLPSIDNFLTTSPSHLPQTPPNSGRSVPFLKTTIFNFDDLVCNEELAANGQDPVSPFFATGFGSREVM